LSNIILTVVKRWFSANQMIFPVRTGTVAVETGQQNQARDINSNGGTTG
jgi:hypothetical protein